MYPAPRSADKPPALAGQRSSAEQRDEADGAGADESPKSVRSKEEVIKRMRRTSRPRPAPAAYPAPRWAAPPEQKNVFELTLQYMANRA